MAVKQREEQQAPARTENRAPARKTLGFLNLNMQTKVGNPIRVEAVRLMEGNKTHEQLAAYLGLQQPPFEGTPEEIVEEKARRLAAVLVKLEISFNPTRTEEEAMLDLV